jgi:UDP:flavonoid glycosyltransferase YjiC (YdhE family)
MCIEANALCAEICLLTAGMLLKRTHAPMSLRGKLMALCAQACEECARECAQHAQTHEHCRICAEVCERCARTCREMEGLQE